VNFGFQPARVDTRCRHAAAFIGLSGFRWKRADKNVKNISVANHKGIKVE
jgi:hypothetical protein